MIEAAGSPDRPTGGQPTLMHGSGGGPEGRVGRAFIDAIVAGDFDWLERLLSPDVRFRAIVPRSEPEAATAAGARAIVEGWFGDTSDRRLLRHDVTMVVDRLELGYRLQFRDGGAWRVSEQHVVATVAADGRLDDVALLCSGFRPIDSPIDLQPDATAGGSSRGDASAGSEVAAPAPRADGRFDAIGLSCATLTPAIRSEVLALAPGQVLEIISDDPSAEDGLRSWTRMTGHELVGTVAGPDETAHLYVRRAGAATPAGKRQGGTH